MFNVLYIHDISLNMRDPQNAIEMVGFSKENAWIWKVSRTPFWVNTLTMILVIMYIWNAWRFSSSLKIWWLLASNKGKASGASRSHSSNIDFLRDGSDLGISWGNGGFPSILWACPKLFQQPVGLPSCFARGLTTPVAAVVWLVKVSAGCWCGKDGAGRMEMPDAQCLK